MPEIDEDKITIIRDKAAKKAETLKQEYRELVGLVNQLSGISKNSKGELPVSILTKKPLSDKVRQIIYDECIEAASRLRI